MEKCVFCKIIKGGFPSNLIWENEDYLAFLDINPINQGHTLLIPKNHVDDIFDLPDKNYSEIFLLAKKLSNAIKNSTKSERVGLAVEGLSVPHVHIHIVPVNRVGDLDPKRAKRADNNELAEIAVLIKNEVKKEFK